MPTTAQPPMMPPRTGPAEAPEATTPSPLVPTPGWQPLQVALGVGERDVLGGKDAEAEAAGVADKLRLALAVGENEVLGLSEAPVEGEGEGVPVTDAVSEAVDVVDGDTETVGDEEGVGVCEGPGTPPLVAFEM